jgi:hypothetical protein
MTQPNPFQPPPSPGRRPMPWWAKLLIILGVVVGLCVLAVVSFIGFIAYSCSHH